MTQRSTVAISSRGVRNLGEGVGALLLEGRAPLVELGLAIGDLRKGVVKLTLGVGELCQGIGALAIELGLALRKLGPPVRLSAPRSGREGRGALLELAIGVPELCQPWSMGRRAAR